MFVLGTLVVSTVSTVAAGAEEPQKSQTEKPQKKEPGKQDPQPEKATAEAAKKQEEKQAKTPAQPPAAEPGHEGHDHSHHGHNHGAPKRQVAFPKANPPGTEEPVETGPPADIEFLEPTFDFGRARAGSPVQHDFKFKNTGEGNLKILRVKSNCGCTVAGSYDQEVAPGQIGKIPVTFDTKRFKGKVKKPLSVFTNVKGKEQVTFVIKGDIWQPIQMSPGSAAFGSADGTKEQTKTITITNNMEDPIALSDVQCNNDKFKVELETVEPGKVFQVHVTTVPPLSDRFNRGLVTINTDVKDIPLLELQASAFVPPAVLVTPNMLRFPKPVTRKMKRFVYIRNSKREPMALSEVKVSDEQLELKILEDTPKGQAYRIVLTAPEGYELPETGVNLTFKTSVAAFPMGTVPLRPLPKPVARNKKPAAAVPATNGSKLEAIPGNDGASNQLRAAARSAKTELRKRGSLGQANRGANQANGNARGKKKKNGGRNKRFLEVLKKTSTIKDAEGQDKKAADKQNSAGAKSKPDSSDGKEKDSTAKGDKKKDSAPTKGSGASGGKN